MQNILYGALILAGIMAVFMAVHAAYVRQHGGKETRLSCGGCASQDTCGNSGKSGCCGQDSRFRAVIFDLDGTLLDTAADLNAAVNAGLAAYGLPARSIEQTRTDIGNGTKMLVHRSVPQGTAPAAEAAVFDVFRSCYAQHPSDKTRVYPGIRGTLSALAGRGVKLAVITNKDSGVALPLIRKFFGERFECVCGWQEGYERKPDPDMFMRCLHSLGMKPEEVLYVGDTEVDAEFSEAAGVPFVLVSWGCRERERLEGLGAAGIIDSPAGLLQFV